MYQNNGYLFSTITPVEVSTDGNIIDMEIRVTEGKPAYFKNISVSGNDKTNDAVIYRELRTRPGQLYSKSNIVRTIRELGHSIYFEFHRCHSKLGAKGGPTTNDNGEAVLDGSCVFP